MFNNFGKQLYDNVIANSRYMLYINGLGRSLYITLGALLLGVLLGCLVAIVKVYSKDYKALKPVSWLCEGYVTLIRGTPMTVQLLIIYYVVFATAKANMAPYIAMFAFGLNSGAYVSEIMRGGILSVDKGQTEAGRALGFGYGQTMLKIVLPQAIKNVIPAIGNELIALIKETSIVSMIGMYDLTMAAKIIGSGNNMASYLVPMAVVAVFYLAVVYILTFAIKLIEKRLRASDKR